MKIDNVRVKENIGEDIIAEAIEFVAGACFVDGAYNPFYKHIACRMAVVRYFIEGIEYDENDSLYVIAENDEVKKVVNRFLTEPKYTDEAKIMAVVSTNADEIIEFRKQRLIHAADSIEYISYLVSSIKGFIEDLDSSLGKILSIDWTSVSEEDIKQARELVSKLNKSGTEINKDTITEVIKEAVDFSSDKASQEIIDAKNAEIIDLRKKVKELEKGSDSK